MKNYGIDWNVRVSSPVKIQLETYYCLNPGSGNEYWNSVTSKVNGITTNQFFLTTGNNYYSINLNMPQNINYNNPIKIKIKANIFPIVNETNPIDMTTSEIMKYITVNPPWGGCPFLYTLVDSNYFEDNNILYKSELENNIGQDITDKYILSLYPDINPVDSTINLKFSEKNDDYSYFDQVKLFAIDHSIDTKVGVTENNDIVLYSPIIISSPDDATQNGDDVTDDLQYEKNDTTYVDGNPNDTINASFSLGKDKIEKSKILKSKIADCFKYIQKVFFQKEFSIKNEIFIDSFAVVLDSWNINNSQTSKNIDAGIITGYESDGSFTSEPKPFTRRQNYSNVIVPISGDDKMIDSVSILWDRDYSISYIGVTPIIYGGYIETELPLVEAVNSNQENLLEHISNQDGDYAQMEKGNDIILKFKCNLPDVQIGMTRDYCFVITGRYNSSGDKIVKTNKVINNNLNELPKTYELSQNYPNPFNPNTTIKFALPKDGFVALKIYDVAGREIVNLVNEYKKAGYYSTQFNGNQFASGVYFYRIQAGNFVQTKKMVLIK